MKTALSWPTTRPRSRYLAAIPERRAFKQIGEALPTIIVNGMDVGSSRERAGPRVILDWLGVSVTAEEGTAEYPTSTGCRHTGSSCLRRSADAA